MRIPGHLFKIAAVAVFVPATANAQEVSRLPEATDKQEGRRSEKSVFDGDFVIVGVGVASAPTYEGSNNSRALPLIGVTGEVSGVSFTIRGPSLTFDLVTIDLSPKVSVSLRPQVRYRFGRSGNLKDDVVAKLGKLDGVVEAGGRVSFGVDEILSRKDKLSFGVSVRSDISGKGGGSVVTPSATYRLPVSRALAFGFLVSTQFIDGDYADYEYGIDAQGSSDSGLPMFRGKGGFKDWTVGVATAYDLSGNVLDGGLSVAGGVIYTRLHGSAANTPITSIRGSRDQWFAGAGLAYIF